MKATVFNRISRGIRIGFYNCNSIRKKIHFIRRTLVRCDNSLLLEILLYEDDISYVSGIDNEFNAHVVSSTCAQSKFFGDSLVGGTALLWRKSINIPVYFKSEHEHYILVDITLSY